MRLAREILAALIFLAMMTVFVIFISGCTPIPQRDPRDPQVIRLPANHNYPVPR